MKNNNNYILFLRLWNLISYRRKVQFLVLIILLLFASFAEIISIGAIIPFLGVLTSPERFFKSSYLHSFINILDVKSPKEMLFPFTILFSTAILFSGILRFLLLWVQTKISYAIGSDFSNEIYKRTLYQPYNVHVLRNSSEIISTISGKVNSVILQVLVPILVIISSTFLLLLIITSIIIYNPQIAFLSIFTLGSIYFIVIKSTKKRLAVDGKRVSVESSQVIKILQEGLGGIRDILLDGTQNTYIDIYEKADKPLRKAQAYITILASSPRFGVESLGIIMIAYLSYYFAIQPEGITLIIPTLGAIALGAQRLLPVLQQLYSSWISIKGNLATLEDVILLLEQPLPEYIKNKDQSVLNFAKEIKLNHISYAYPTNSQLVLKDINLTIEKGSKIGIIGTTGSGKSTLLDIFMGLLEPTSGFISVDNEKLTKDNMRGWQLHLAHVPQNVFLSDATIAENIAFGVSKNMIDFRRIKDVSKKAQISDFIESLHDKYNNIVGEAGVRISGGQKQRLAIARAFYKNANVIIFDEATSALDNETEKEVMKSIEKISSELTLIIVAHRLTTLKNCDKIIELCNGEVKRIGTYDEIINDNVDIVI
jgi:ATP-binding cassette subfamily B protein